MVSFMTFFEFRYLQFSKVEPASLSDSLERQGGLGVREQTSIGMRPTLDIEASDQQALRDVSVSGFVASIWMDITFEACWSVVFSSVEHLRSESIVLALNNPDLIKEPLPGF